MPEQESPEIEVEPDNGLLNGSTLMHYHFFVNFSYAWNDNIRDYRQEEELSYKIETEAMLRLEHDIDFLFGKRVDMVFQGSVTSVIDRIERGSILGTVSLILTAGLTLYEFTSQYKDFYESVTLLRDQLRAVIDRSVTRSIMGTGYPADVKHSTSVVTTPSSALARAATETAQASGTLPVSQSTFFFWYLFIVHILLFIVVVALVYQAVAATYFASP